VQVVSPIRHCLAQPHLAILVSDGELCFFSWTLVEHKQSKKIVSTGLN
jgi:hypothetical protein